jgi:hypothetical protein
MSPAKPSAKVAPLFLKAKPRWKAEVPGYDSEYFARLPAIVMHALGQSAVSGSAWAVFCVAWHRWSTRQREEWIRLPGQELAHFGIDHSAQWRAVQALARAGLIARRHDGPGQSLQLSLHPTLRQHLPQRRRQ